MPSIRELTKKQIVGQSQGIQKHITKMIPVLEEQHISELKKQEQSFEQEVRHIETLSDVMRRAAGTSPQQVVFQQGSPQVAKPPLSKNMLLIGIGLLAWLYFKR